MNMWTRAIIFWALIVASSLLLWRAASHDLRDTLWTGIVVVPFVVLVFWFLGRFTGARKRTATLMVDSALAAVVAGLVVVWKLISSATFGFWERRSLMEAAIAGVVFLASVSVSVWSFWRLRRSAATTN